MCSILKKEMLRIQFLLLYSLLSWLCCYSVKCLTGIEELTDESTVPLQLYRAEEWFSCGSLSLFSFSIMQLTADRHSERSACEHRCLPQEVVKNKNLPGSMSLIKRNNFECVFSRIYSIHFFHEDTLSGEDFNTACVCLCFLQQALQRVPGKSDKQSLSGPGSALWRPWGDPGLRTIPGGQAERRERGGQRLSCSTAEGETHTHCAADTMRFCNL